MISFMVERLREFPQLATENMMLVVAEIPQLATTVISAVVAGIPASNESASTKAFAVAGGQVRLPRLAPPGASAPRLPGWWAVADMKPVTLEGGSLDYATGMLHRYKDCSW